MCSVESYVLVCMKKNKCCKETLNNLHVHGLSVNSIIESFIDHKDAFRNSDWEFLSGCGRKTWTRDDVAQLFANKLYPFKFILCMKFRVYKMASGHNYIYLHKGRVSACANLFMTEVRVSRQQWKSSELLSFILSFPYLDEPITYKLANECRRLLAPSLTVSLRSPWSSGGNYPFWDTGY